MRSTTHRIAGAPRIRALAAGLVTCLLAATASPQGMLVRHYTQADGLPTPKVIEIRRAPSGLLWFATRSGLFEYDGAVWSPRLAERLGPVREVRAVRFDEHGEAWVLCRDGVLLREDASAPTPDRVGVPRDVGAYLDFELLHFAGQSSAAVVDSQRGLLIWNGVQWSSPDFGAAGVQPFAIETFDGRLHVGSSLGLSVVAGSRVVPAAVVGDAIPSGPVRALAPATRHGTQVLWVLGNGWAGTLDAAGVFELVHTDIPVVGAHPHVPTALAVGPRGDLYYGDDWGLHHVEASTGEGHLVDDCWGLVGRGVNELAIDDSGSLWAATEVGAFQFPNLPVRTWHSTEGLLEDEVTAVAELADGTIALGHVGGLTFLDGEEARSLRFEPIDPEFPVKGRVMSLWADPEGPLWAAVAGKGVARIRAGEPPQWFPAPPEAESTANAVVSDGEGGLLVGTTAGLWRLEHGEYSQVLEEGLGAPYVRWVACGRDDDLYLTTPRGVLVRSQGRWTRYGSHENHPRVDHFFTVCEGRDGVVWFGGSDGLWVLGEDGLERAPEAYRVDGPVYSLVEDARGRLWIGTATGIAYSDGQRLVSLDWIAPHTGFEANRGAAFRDSRDRVWMGTASGVAVFDGGFELPSEPPRVEVLGVSVAGEPLPLDEPVRAESSKSDLAFEVRAVSFLAEGTVEFRSRMRGFSEWELDVGPTRLVKRFTGLPPGEYAFEVQARVPGTPFSAVSSSPTIDVSGPLWTRTWFLGLMFGVTVLLTAAAVLLVTQHRHARKLETEIEARSRELEASLDELAKTDRLRSLGLLAGGIAHDLRNVLTVFTGNLSLLEQQADHSPVVRAYVESTERALRRASTLARQLQTFASGGAPVTSAVELEDLARECAKFVLTGSSVEAEFDFPDHLWSAEADGSQIEQVLENLLHNARQCQPHGGRVRLSGRNTRVEGSTELPAGDYVEVLVSDDGPGIPGSLRERIFEPFFTTKSAGSGLGLATAHSIVRRHGGLLELLGDRDRPTTFRVVLPAATAEQTEEDDYVLEPVPALDSARVLVVDDEASIRTMLAQLLDHLGLEPIVAEDSRQAIEAVERALEEGRPFEYAILDLNLPGDCSGEELLALLHERDPDLASVASSGNVGSDALERPREHGFDAALPKPYELSDLALVLRDLRRGRGAASVDRA